MGDRLSDIAVARAVEACQGDRDRILARADQFLRDADIVEAGGEEGLAKRYRGIAERLREAAEAS